MMVTWLICGGRNYHNVKAFKNAMRHLIRTRGRPDLVVHGGATGADTFAGKWAERAGVEVTAVPASWDTFGKAAGPIRNQKMLREYAPDLVVAFHGGSGTADMVRRAMAADIEVVEIMEAFG